MLNDDRNPYPWQDHVITPQHARAKLVTTALIVLVPGAAVMFAVVGAVSPSPPPAAHVATEWTPPSSQLAKQPARPRLTRGWL